MTRNQNMSRVYRCYCKRQRGLCQRQNKHIFKKTKTWDIHAQRCFISYYIFVDAYTTHSSSVCGTYSVTRMYCMTKLMYRYLGLGMYFKYKCLKSTLGNDCMVLCTISHKEVIWMYFISMQLNQSEVRWCLWVIVHISISVWQFCFPWLFHYSTQLRVLV